jgi:hypothetical protein
MGKKQREKKVVAIAAHVKEENRIKREAMSSTARIAAVDPMDVIIDPPDTPAQPADEMRKPSNVASFTQEKAQRVDLVPTYLEHGEDMARLLAAADAAENGCAMGDAILVHRDEIETWDLPPFQRPLKDNAKVGAYREKLRESGGCIGGGVITLGRIAGDSKIYKVDGQHRLHAALTSGLDEFILTIHIKRYGSFAEMAKDYVELQDSLVPMTKDDILKAAMENIPQLRTIITQCTFVGFDNIRRATAASKLVSMSAALNCWIGSAQETPGAKSVPTDAAKHLPDDEIAHMCTFLNLCHSAWSNDIANHRLWGNLNLTMCAWMFRQLVLKSMSGVPKKLTHTTMDAMTFRKCLLTLAADHNYVDFLFKRNMHERDRNPTYRKLKAIFIQRLNDEETRAGRPPKKNLKFPAPAWSKGRV